MMSYYKACICNVCKNSGEPLKRHTRYRHEKLYGVYLAGELSSEIGSEGSILQQESTTNYTSDNKLSGEDPLIEDSSEDELPEEEGSKCGSASSSPVTDVESDNSSSDDSSDSESSSDPATNSEEIWSFEYDKSIYKEGPAIEMLPNSNMTVLQWLAVNFALFATHPSMSKAAFTHSLQVQKLTHGDVANTVPSSYYEAKKLIQPYLVKKVVFDVCVNECVIFWNCGISKNADLLSCPECGENRYYSSSTDSKKSRKVARRRFIYVPVGPRLARLYGEVNLAQLVSSHPGGDYAEEEMWDIHHSPTWKALYSENGYFSGDKMGISLALELDGVNPFHNIGVMYSMTPIMLTILNLPRHIRNAFGNIHLVGIIPAKDKSESSKLSPYMEILVDELLFLTKCTTYNAYKNAPVDVKIKLLLYILDYPGLSKLFKQHGSGSLAGCHWCHVRGEYNKHLNKVVYFSNRSYLDSDNPMRHAVTRFASKSEELTDKPRQRDSEEDSSYREAFEKAKNKTQAQLVSTATGCKQSYSICKLPGHDRVNETLPDCCHTVKDVVQNIMNIVTGNYVDVNKIAHAEKQMSRLHTLQRSDSGGTEWTGKQSQPKRRKTDTEEQSLPYMLTKSELKSADKRAEKVRVPIDFGLKPSSFISKPGSLKSHDWKQIATQGILKYCLKNCLSQRCRETLFLVLDSLTSLCSESVFADDVDQIEKELNLSLALLERDFPLSLANITTHILHHIPEGIRRFGPVYGTWMYVFERFNSWICKRALNMRYPEATAIETFIIHDWCNFMVSTDRIPDIQTKSNQATLDGISNPESPDVQSSKSDSAHKKHMVLLKRRDTKLIHKQLDGGPCRLCCMYKYSYHKAVHQTTKRATIFTSRKYEAAGAKTVSSYVNCEFDRGGQGRQKLDNGLFLQFGRINYFIEHVPEYDLAGNMSNKSCFANIEWYDNLQYDSDTKLWYSDLRCNSKRKHSFIKVEHLSKPIVTAEEESEMCHEIWFLNSGKRPCSGN